VGHCGSIAVIENLEIGYLSPYPDRGVWVPLLDLAHTPSRLGPSIVDVFSDELVAERVEGLERCDIRGKGIHGEVWGKTKGLKQVILVICREVLRVFRQA
jgi:hypothetical protein